VLAHRWRGGSTCRPGPLRAPDRPQQPSSQHGVHGQQARQAGDVTVSVKSTLTRLKGREHDTREAPGGRPLCLVRLAVRELPLEPHYMRMLEEGHGTRVGRL
jgi:hypothetical protein